MTFWRKLKQVSAGQPQESKVQIDLGELSYYRSNGALTRIDIDDLSCAELRVIANEVYWYLEDKSGAYVLVPEQCSGIGELRRYLSSWRGFNYDGLLRFDMARQVKLQLWPLEQARAA